MTDMSDSEQSIDHHRGCLIICPACKESIETDLSTASARWMVDASLICDYCGQPVDLFSALTQVLRSPLWLTRLAVAGVVTTHVARPLRPMVLVDLPSLGIPENARLLRVAWVLDEDQRLESDGEFTGQLFLSGQREFPVAPGPVTETLSFFLHTWSEQSLASMGVRLYFAWAPPEIAEEAETLVRAMDALTSGRPRDAIVPANVAVEHAINRTVREIVDRYATSSARSGYSDSRIDYADKLEYILPAFAALLQVSSLSPEVRGKLARLRDLRNKVSHGSPLAPTVDSELPDLLAAAVLGMEYARLVAQAAAARGA